MKNIFISIMVISVIAISCLPLRAQPVSIDEANTVAQNWIRAIIDKKGDWGGFDTAQINEIVAFTHKGKTVGYFCKVEPRGFILVSMRRELAPIKAYSARNDLDPEAEEGLTDLLRGQMGSILNRFENLEASAVKQATQINKADSPEQPVELEIDYRSVWDSLENHPEIFMTTPPVPEETRDMGSDSDSGGDAANYQEGEILLTSHWHQFPPYNNDCPHLGCSQTSNGRAVVGCVATAAAQLMRYWNWPPYGSGTPYNDLYDWPNMPDVATTSSSAAVQAAVAELSREIGRAVGMDYGCSSSSVPTSDMEGVYESQYRYSNVYRRNRDDYSAIGWFDLMKEEFNWNRPVQYRITDHSIVGDGWQEIGISVVRQYHMVYGWTGASDDTWYTLDTMTSDPEDEEYLLENIRPGPYMLDLDDNYPRDSFPYRYFYRDTWGSGGTFAGGQRLQFLPGVFVHGTSADPVTIQGSASYYTYLFTRGNLTNGIRMLHDSNAAIKMYNGGGIILH